HRLLSASDRHDHFWFYHVRWSPYVSFEADRVLGASKRVGSHGPSFGHREQDHTGMVVRACIWDTPTPTRCLDQGASFFPEKLIHSYVGANRRRLVLALLGRPIH